MGDREMSFQYWRDEVADMPHQQEDGTWEDLETGFTYEMWKQSQQSPRKERTKYEQKRHDRTVTTRKAAKALGGKALAGTAKQKAWAEDIRKKVIAQLIIEQAEFLVSAPFCGAAKFWIEAREHSANEIFQFVTEIQETIKKANELNRQGDNGQEWSALVDKYEAMKKSWNLS